MVDVMRPTNDEDLLMRPLIDMPAAADEADSDSPYDSVESDFDPASREDFIGLLHLGSLKSKESMWGHAFSLQTPSQRERLEAGVLHKPYINTVAGEAAWATITVAMYLQKVDEVDLPGSITPKGTGVEDRLGWVLDNLRPEVISRLFERCLMLDSRVAEVLKEMETQGKA